MLECWDTTEQHWKLLPPKPARRLTPPEILCVALEDICYERRIKVEYVKHVNVHRPKKQRTYEYGDDPGHWSEDDWTLGDLTRENEDVIKMVDDAEDEIGDVGGGIIGASFGGKIEIRKDLGYGNPDFACVFTHEVAHEVLHAHTYHLPNWADMYEHGRHEDEAETSAKTIILKLDIPWRQFSYYRTDNVTPEGLDYAQMVIGRYKHFECQNLVSDDWYNPEPAADHYKTIVRPYIDKKWAGHFNETSLW